MQNFDCIMVGAACCDIIFNDLPSMPKPGEEVWASGFMLTVGGMMNSAAALSRLGKRVGLVTAFGTDIWGDIIASKMAEEGVSAALVHRLPEPYPQITVSFNYQDDRSMVSYGDGGRLSENFKAHLLSVIRRHEAGIYHFSSQQDYTAFIQEARMRRRIISLDAVWDEAWLQSSGIRDQIRMADIFMPNLMEAQTITGKQDAYEALDVLAELVPLAVIKMGGEGAIAKMGGEVFQANGFHVEPVDLTGAGDCFASGFLYGWLNRMPVEQCLKIANYCGSRCVQAVGGYTGAPKESNLIEALQAL